MKRPTIKLPTFEAFAALPLIKRARLFGRWLKAQPRRKTYVYARHGECALGQFANALLDGIPGRGIVRSIRRADSRDEVNVFPHDGFGDNAVFSNAICYGSTKRLWQPGGSYVPRPITFGRASDAYQKALRSAVGKRLLKEAISS